jgi:hypothetical protein
MAVSTSRFPVTGWSRMADCLAVGGHPVAIDGDMQAVDGLALAERGLSRMEDPSQAPVPVKPSTGLEDAEQQPYRIVGATYRWRFARQVVLGAFQTCLQRRRSPPGGGSVRVRPFSPVNWEVLQRPVPDAHEQHVR